VNSKNFYFSLLSPVAIVLDGALLLLLFCLAAAAATAAHSG